MKYLLGKLNIGGKQFSYNDVIEKIPTGFEYDYYGGNVQYFGKTVEGFLLCVKKNKAEIIDIYIDEDLLTTEGLKLLLKDRGKEYTEKPAKQEKPEKQPIEETPERLALIEQAKELGLRGVLQNMKDETLIKKIKEAQGEKEN